MPATTERAGRRISKSTSHDAGKVARVRKRQRAHASSHRKGRQRVRRILRDRHRIRRGASARWLGSDGNAPERSERRPLRFNRAAVAIRPDRIGIAGDICTDPAFFRSRNLAVRYRGDQETPFSAVFENSGPAHFEALVRVSEFRLPVAGGELQVTLPDRPMVLSTQPLSRTVDEFIVVDPQPMIVTKLEQGVIRVRSPENLLDLKFTFEGFELHWGRLGAPVLTRTKKGAYYVDGLMVVEFPPQHLSRDVTGVPGGSPGCVDAEPLEKTWCPSPRAWRSPLRAILPPSRFGNRRI
jgi:hypothetical protein